ncbi:MAG: hypothetical protein HOC71_12495 [Candidatus Latescibacteria bacterium]|nr:hypothetical protein [Candidatus Latescibacterota bacterium]
MKTNPKYQVYLSIHFFYAWIMEKLLCTKKVCDMRIYKTILILLAFLFLVVPIIYADTYEKFVEDANNAGHKDISIIEHSDTLRVWYWPLGFRSEFDAYKDIRNRTHNYVNQSKGTFKHIELIQLSWGIPVIYSRSESEKPITYDTFNNAYHLQSPKQLYNNNLRKFLVQINFPLSIQFGNIDDPFIYKTGIRPDFRYLISSNLFAYGQVDLYVHNEFNPNVWYKPANLGMVFWKTFPKNIISFTNIGVFTHKELSGIDEKLIIPLFNDSHSFVAHVGYFRYANFIDNTFYYGTKSKKLALAKYTWLYSPYDCSLAILGGRFLEGDTGWGMEISRIFNEVEFGLSAIISDDDFNGHIRVSVPLLPRNRASLSTHGIAVVRDFDLTYHYAKVYKGNEPEVGISFREIERYAKPTHFRHMVIQSK